MSSIPRLFFRANLPRRPVTPRFFSTAAPPPKPSLSQRMKQLSKEYGYSAVAVYLGLSALDFPFCFLAVRMIGTEKIAEYEHTIVEGARSLYHAAGLPGWEKKQVEEEEKNHKAATIWTELALAYAIHKSLIFIRVPITAAVTPKVVKTLRKWGWDIGKKGGLKNAVKGKKTVE
ncbi:hypothetical protein FPQ18DRAFT_374089 [Pyronema domesticum]|uniref:Similar to Uncharacterized protein C106.07c acc. no. Q9URV4 n=1 Tax=Pyronema omphalodes (strain CBS 100304) TaxID=1076935 RepID=U4KYD3_PYROM|nr:hypothetical protein FPQ18DRAFT_374089 [Pyronema domesticum]CCX07237.1 Similar to Uncharacterized protein C106.07c; acc. no. Q9URV4 [Pyronema omphalodes CBS 100304]